MSNSASILTFIIVSFCFALILIMKKDTLPSGFKRPLAILAIVMVVFSFTLIVYSFFSLGTGT
ncbi:hypothetical protein N0M98_08535 [Paenibacillus doosanensis]|uniref:Signal transduction histidine kinase n=1 Tax=Paenibacillus konkukensis TaxID=2020716 RepID=A0ABY4RK38_9BACL|nr:MULTISPECIES: hypothetical protein [Paenibacillus]MCS7460186.1 hypothetical protein [Paenibacillus doosanensis]UQZ82846.1 hypothetical protein SK3146_02006 [Paenibacillus konkukensis]